MPRLEVVAAVFTRGEEVLACRRAPGRSAAGKWEFPGGKIDDDDNASPVAALVREIREELGLSITVGQLIDRSVTRVGDHDIDLACYFVTSADTPIESTDHDELRWVPRSALGTLDWAAPDLPAVAALTTTAVEVKR